MKNRKKIIFLTIIVVLTMLLLVPHYKCLESKGNSSCLVSYSASFFYILATILILIFIISFKSELEKLLYLIIEFLIIIFGIYGVLYIKSVIELGFLFESFRLVAFLLIFVLIASLLYIRELLKKKQ